MSEHLRALVVILLIAGSVMVITRPILTVWMTLGDFNRRRNAWLGVTLLAFLSHNFWVFLAGSSLVLWTSYRVERNVPALFWLLLFVVPPVDAPIPGFGLINFLFDLSFQRLLALVVLLPAALQLWRSKESKRLGSTWPDRFLLAYLALSAVLSLRNASATQGMREAFYLVLEVLLPYYVFSRGLTQLTRIKEAMSALVWATVLLAALGMFEFAKSWLLYTALPRAWGVDFAAGYLSRDGLLRASATTGQAIVLGYSVAVGLGCYLALSKEVPSKAMRLAGWATMVGGLLAPLSRGPWVGAAVMAMGYLFTGPRGVRRVLTLTFAGLAAIPLLSLFPFGKRLVGMLPFLGDIETENINYRERLFENALILVDRNFWLGTYDYRERLADMGMVQGQGIVDVVNTYVRVALEHGVLGLLLFSLFFAAVVLQLHRATKRWNRHTRNAEDDMQRTGRALLASLVGLLAMIATVSSISFIPWIYWTVAGAAAAYADVVNRSLKSEISRAR